YGAPAPGAPPAPGGPPRTGFDPTFDAANREAPPMSLGYRAAGAPPPPGASTDLPPGYLSREEKSKVQRHKKNTGRFKIAIGALILLVCVGATIVLTKKKGEPEKIG